MSADSYGNKNDASEYYGVGATANGGAMEIVVRNSRFTVSAVNIHNHGIRNGVAVANLQISNNQFENLNDAIEMLTTGSGAMMITGNNSVSTQGSASVIVTGVVAFSYEANVFDKPLQSAVSSCGTDPAISGGLSGVITVGTGGTTSCVMTLPFAPLGTAGGACIFATDVPLSAGPAGAPPVWTISGGATDLSGKFIVFNCRPGQ